MYNTDFFINKFEAIPSNRWTTGSGGIYGENTKCALGHCGGWVPDSSESLALAVIMEQLYAINERGNKDMMLDEFVFLINDGLNDNYQQPTPKQRILAALYDIKANEAVKEVQELVNQNQSIEQKAEVETIVK